MKRKFVIILTVFDEEAPEETPEVSAEALKGFILDQLGYLTFDVKEIEVTCENV